MKTKVVAVATAVAALVAGPVAAAPAHAQTCSVFTGPPEYACVTAVQTYNFVANEGNEAIAYTYDLAGDAVFGVVCIVFPGRPECQ